MKFNIVNYSNIEYHRDTHWHRVSDYFHGIYSKYIKENYWCLDIGANCGDTSFPMVDYTGLDGKIICFEPKSNVFDLLEKNVARTNLSSVMDIYNVATDTAYGDKYFSMPPNDLNGGIIEGFCMEERGPINYPTLIKCIDVSHFLIETYGMKNLTEKLKFIKIDIEGYDYIVLNHLKEIIQSAKPVILMEWWSHISKNDNIFDMIDSLDYQVFRADTDAPVTREDFDRKSEDLILIPR